MAAESPPHGAPRVDPEDAPSKTRWERLAELVSRGQDPAHRPVPRRAPRRSAGPTPCTRSPRCRPSTRSGPATPRRRCCLRCADSVSVSSLIRRWAAVSSPVRSARWMVWPTGLPPNQPEFAGDNLEQEPAHGGRGRRRSRKRPARRRRRWRWPGLSPRGTTSPDPRHQAGRPDGGEHRGGGGDTHHRPAQPAFLGRACAGCAGYENMSQIDR